MPAGGGGGIETFVPCARGRFVLVWCVRWYELKTLLLVILFTCEVGFMFSYSSSDLLPA